MVTNHYYESAVFSIISSANRLRLNTWGDYQKLIDSVSEERHGGLRND